MKKLSVIFQYLVVIGLFGFIGYAVFRPIPSPDINPATWSNWDGFSVISFAGIDRENSGPYVTRERLEEQLGALHKASYNCITPEEALSFLNGQSPLPDKAILLLFEGGRKEAMIRATPILQKLGMRATLLVPTVYTEKWGTFFVKKNEIKKIMAMPHWHIASMGHEAAIDIPVDEQGKTGRFLAERRQTKNGKEMPEEFRSRIRSDYIKSRAILTDAAGTAPLLYTYPFADTGSGPNADPAAEEINRTAVMDHFAMAITRADHSFNGADSDPYALARLRTSGLWSGEDLVKRLMRDEPRHTMFSAISEGEDWMLDFDAALVGSAVALPPRSAAWLRGTDNWDDADIEAEISAMEPGAVVALYARYSGPRSFVRLTLDAKELVLQEQLPAAIQTIARIPVEHAENQPAIIRLRVRNNRAWIYFNGQEAGRSLPLVKTTRRGRIGLGAEYAAARVSQFTARPLPAYVLKLDRPQISDPVNDDQIKFVVAPWIELSGSFAMTAESRANLLQLASQGIGIIPDAGNLQEAGSLTSWITRESLAPLVQTIAMNAVNESSSTALHNSGIHTMLMVNEADAGPAAKWIKKANDGSILLITPNGLPESVPVKSLSRLMPSRNIYILSEAKGMYIPADELLNQGSGG